VELSVNSIKIVFGSCTRFHAGRTQPVWDRVAAIEPDYLALLGDQIYMDYGFWPFAREYIGRPKKYSVEAFERVMRQKYAQQWSVPNFHQLISEMQAKNGLLGTWDDHDFTWNNAYGAERKHCKGENDCYQMEAKRQIARKLFHEYMNCSSNQPEVYCYRDTPVARLIVLDNRYYAMSHKTDNPALLGAEQMAFLKEKLQHDLPYTIIFGGLTLTYSRENWSNYDREFSDFLAMVDDKKVLYVGGDIHHNKFSIIDPYSQFPLYQAASSGMSLDWGVLPLKLDYTENWGLLTLNQEAVSIQFYNKRGLSFSEQIDVASWRLHA